VCSATGIVRVAKQLLDVEMRSSVLKNDATLTAKLVFDAAKANDSLALEVVDIFGKYLARGMELLAVSVNPAVFVIGGGVSKAGDILLDAVKKHFGQNVFAPAIRDVEIKFARLGNDAGVIGAARHARSLVSYDK